MKAAEGDPIGVGFWPGRPVDWSPELLSLLRHTGTSDFSGV
jgi:hypothetical protein